MREVLKNLIYGNPFSRFLERKVALYLRTQKEDFALEAIPENHSFVIVIPSYNNLLFYRKNLISALEQRYQRYRIVYIDDCSTDGTADAVEKFVAEFSSKISFSLVRNQANRGALANLYDAVHECDPNEIIVVLDGDDWLAHEFVLKKLNWIYSQRDTWLTYGQYIEYPRYFLGRSEPIPSSLLTPENLHQLRQKRWMTSHLRTFYASLFHKIERQDLLWNGEMAKVASDVAIMFPMVEMALGHSRFVSEVLYVYNSEQPLNDHAVRLAAQLEADKYFRSLKPYKPVSSRF